MKFLFDDHYKGTGMMFTDAPTATPPAPIIDLEPPFWLVWRRHGRNPVFLHDTYESARKEAERLAAAHPGWSFYVLAPAAAGFEQNSVRWHHCSGCCDIC